MIYILGYIKGTIDFGIVYRRDNIDIKGIEPLKYYNIEHNVEAYIGTSLMLNTIAFLNSNYATNPRDWKSIKGFIFIIYRGAILFSSCKLKSIARSIAEAKYIALSNTTK